MLKVSKVGVLLAVMALSGLMASSASAANWHTNGVKAFSSTNAGISRLVIHPTVGGSTVTVQCPTSGGTGTINGPTSAALPWTNAATVTPVFGSVGNCTVSGAAGYTVACGSAELRANSYSGGDTLATAGGGRTEGSITNIDCRVSAGATACSTVTGSVTAHYTNPNPIATGAGTLTITNANSALTVEPIGAGCLAIPSHGTGTFGSPVGAGVGDTTYVVDGPNAPYIYRGT